MRSPVGPWSPTLADAQPSSVDRSFDGIRRHALGDDAWVDHLEEWLVGAGSVFDELAAGLSWQAPDVLMYGRHVAQPRRSACLEEQDLYASGRPAGAVLEELRAALQNRYGVTLGAIGCNFYRGGQDSVAWHGDRIARELQESIIAIVSVGARRPFRLRPRGGGLSHTFRLGHGDLLVMGGTCQRTWQHTVPKVAAAGPRISITFRQHVAPAPSGLPWERDVFREPPAHHGRASRGAARP